MHDFCELRKDSHAPASADFNLDWINSGRMADVYSAVQQAAHQTIFCNSERSARSRADGFSLMGNPLYSVQFCG